MFCKSEVGKETVPKFKQLDSFKKRVISFGIDWRQRQITGLNKQNFLEYKGKLYKD